jgi:hypothetical protein
VRGDTIGVKPADGTIYVVAGSAGAPLYTNGTQNFTQFSQETYNFAIVKVVGKNLDYKAYDDKSNVIDTFTIAK